MSFTQKQNNYCLEQLGDLNLYPETFQTDSALKTLITETSPLVGWKKKLN